jgi:hypothetical protein
VKGFAFLLKTTAGRLCFLFIGAGFLPAVLYMIVPGIPVAITSTGIPGKKRILDHFADNSRKINGALQNSVHL